MSDTPGPAVFQGERWTVDQWNAFFASLGHKVDDVNGFATNLTVIGGPLAQVPIGIVIPGRPAAGQVFYLSIPFACSVPAGFAGTTVYDGTQPAANATFSLNRITAGNVSTALGTITITNSSHSSATLAGAGGVLVAGDALQIVCPSPQDPTLADLGLTIFATRM